MSLKSMFSKPEKEFLNIQRVARIATIDPNCHYPHMVPICFTFDGISFYTTLPKESERTKNIKNGSNVSILIDKYEEQGGEWLTLQGLLIKCKVSLLSFYDNKDLFMKGWRMLIEKYPQYRRWANENLNPKDPDRRLIMQIQPVKKTAWGFVS